jgi:hypothetical protein
MIFRTLAFITAITKSGAFAFAPRSTFNAFAASSRHHLGAVTISSWNSGESVSARH